MDEKPKFISLFSGVGVFDLALEESGFECASVCEIDRQAQNVLRRHFPNATLYDDVRKVGKETHEPGTIELICGGPPCQDFSVAGKRKGIAGERSGLWFEFARVIDELEPRWVIFENVPGLYSSWSPVATPPCEMEVRDFDTREEAERWKREMASDWIVEESNDFETIISFFQERGYGVVWRILDSQYFGVPQRRRRVFLVASLGNGSCAEVLFERERLPGNSQKSAQARKVAATISSSGAGTSRTGNGNEVDLLVAFDQAQITSPENRTNMQPGDPAPTLNQEGRLSIFLAGAGAKAGSVSPSESTSPTLRSSGGLNMMPSVALSGTVSAKWAKGTGGPAGDEVQSLVLAGPVTTINTANAGANQNNAKVTDTLDTLDTLASTAVQLPSGVRRLTPTECERLQGLPDGWTAWGIDAKGNRIEQADSPRYKQCGNAVTRNPVAWIARRIMGVIRHD